MEKEILIQLTIDLYKLTLLFPKKEPLRYKIRELADDILVIYLKSDFNDQDHLEVCYLVGVLDSFFTIARKQNWVSDSELLNIAEKYVNLRQRLEGVRERQPMVLETVTAEAGTGFDDLSKSDQRRNMILDILKEKGKAQVWEFKKIFPELSKRTLRRDFEKMLSQDLVERVGERNQTFYQLKPVRETSVI
ncbi:DeoR family transcriptional regulator [Candidatus Parcubacteria bacterium]|nr:DeoR family transcriptional regulator [Candidatus Parcubacteria bacterium]